MDSENFGLAGSFSVAGLAEEVLPGVVQVRVGDAGHGRPRGGGPRGWPPAGGGFPRGAGAGFVWDPGGSEEGPLVVTNHHVVAAAGGRGSRSGGGVEVVLADEQSFRAEVVGESRSLDLALLRLLGDAPEENLTALPVGDSDALRPGELVFAVGHPWGRRGAVTAGVVVAVGPMGWRGVRGGPRGGARYVQTDAALAPGNSGGPLVNARGEVVGVNAMILGGLSLAIPSNAARAWAASSEGDAGRPRLGVGVRAVPLPAPLRAAAGQDRGLLVVTVEPGGPAGRSGVLVGDVLLGLSGSPGGAAGETFEDAGALLEAVSRARGAGPRDERLSLRLLRGGVVRGVVATGLGSAGPASARASA